MNDLVAKLFEFVGFMQVVASIIHLLMTWSHGTPLKDSHTPSQLKIKYESVRRRRRAYYMGLILAFVSYALHNSQL